MVSCNRISSSAAEKTRAALLVPSGPLQAPLVSIAPPDSLPCRCPPGRLFMHVPMLIPATGLRLEGEAPLRDHHGATRCHHQSSRAGPRISQPLFSPSPPAARRSVLAPSRPGRPRGTRSAWGRARLSSSCRFIPGLRVGPGATPRLPASPGSPRRPQGPVR